MSQTAAAGATVNRVRRSRRPIRLTALLALTGCAVVASFVVAGAASGSTVAATGTQKLTVYSNPVHEAFVANADDELRGDVSNPFGTHISRAAAGLTNLDEKNGPFPGDEALYSFDLFKNANLEAKAGSAVYTCQYYFDKYAYCDVSFQLIGGSLIGAGAFSFASKSFALAITGGYGKYSGVTGDVNVSSSGTRGQRLVFALG
jgi:hypothetical protein